MIFKIITVQSLEYLKNIKDKNLYSTKKIICSSKVIIRLLMFTLLNKRGKEVYIIFLGLTSFSKNKIL
jgi:hypothetical protein